MSENKSKYFSEAVTVFQERWLPEAGIPVGYAALIQGYKLSVPLPRILSAIGTRHSVFAMKYEGLDLAVLKR